MSCKILISTTVNWTSTARHAAGFAMAGCKVDAVAPAGAPVNLSRHVLQRHRYRSLSPERSLREAISASRPDLIVSCDDRAMDILLRLYRCEPEDSILANVIRRSVGVPENYPLVMSRENSLRAARELGIRVPETLPVSSEDALRDALKLVGLPAVLKVDGTWGGEGVAVVRSKVEAHAAFHRLSRPISPLRGIARAARRRDGHWLAAGMASQRPLLTLQAFVSGEPAASGFAAWNGAVVGAVYYDVIKADRSIGPPSVIRRLDCPEMAEVTRLVAGHFGLSGLHGLDFIRDASGHVHLLEINPRATQGGTLPFGPGRDLAAELAACVWPRAKPRAAIDKETVVFFPGEWLRNPASEYFRSAHHDVPWDDPAVLQAALQDKMASRAEPITASRTVDPSHLLLAASTGTR